MKRPYAAVLAICVLGVVIGGISFYAFIVPGLFPEAPDFSWGAQVNETLMYEIRTYGYSAGGDYNESEVDEILALNQSRIYVTIASLPNLSSVVDSTSFKNIVVEIDKVSCRFANGTSIPLDRNQDIVRALSGCILPTGDWPLIDSYFVDESPGWSPGETVLLTRLHDDYFFIGWEWYGSIDDSGGWSGNVRLTDGIPTQVIWRYTHMGGISIKLNLIE